MSDRNKEMRDTSRSLLLWAAVANSPAAKSCSSLAATGFDLRVSRTALRAWVWACRCQTLVVSRQDACAVQLTKVSGAASITAIKWHEGHSQNVC
jgi:hypothetical protein